MDAAWKAKVWEELRRRKMSPRQLADAIARPRSGVYKLLNTPLAMSSYVDEIDKELGTGHAFVPVGDVDPVRLRFAALVEKLPREDQRILLELLETLTARRPE